MKTIIETYIKAFMLTGQHADPRDLDFTFYTHEKVTYNPEARPSLKEYYMNYDENTDTFSDLAVQCVYTYTLDGQGNVTKRVEDISWFFDDNSVGVTRQLIQVNE